MRNSILLAKANLKKNKSNAISLTLVMLFVAMFINIGFVMMFGIGSFFDQRADELNTGHIVTHLSRDSAFADAQVGFMQQDYRVQTIEIQDMVIGNGHVVLDGMPDLGLLMFSPVYEHQQLNPLTMVGDYLPLTGNGIYVPHFMVLSGGLALGDILEFSFMEIDLEFTFAGSIDEIMFGSINAWRRRMYVSEEIFAALQQQFPGNMTAAMVARFYDASRTGVFLNDYLDYVLALPPTPDSQEVISLTHNFIGARGSHTLMPTIVGMILAVFAIVFLAVSLIVIRFRINNSIDEGMTNIGVLKALGYSNGQIIISILMQFGFIAAMGGAVGLVLGQIVLPSVAGIMGPMFSLQWQPEVNVLAKLIMLALIFLSVILFSLLSTRRIYKLYPLVALRGGVTVRGFRGSTIPLDKVGGPLAFLLAAKDFLQNKKQAIGVGIIILAISFTAASGLATNYVVNVNNEEFLNVMVGEPFDIGAILRSADYSEAFIERISQNPQVDRITGLHSGVRYVLEDTIIFADIVEDHTKLQGQTLVSGRFPIYYNEISLDRQAMGAIDANIGDWVTIRSGGEEFQFVITGLTQSMNAMGGNLTGEGMRHMIGEFEFLGFYIFLEDGVCGITFAEMLRETEGAIFAEIIVFDEIAESFIASMGGIFEAVAIMILAVVTLIVIATMYLVIKTAILRKRRELGIQKALGFTTFQLMNQVALNLTPAIIIGSVAGAVVAYNIFDLFFVVVTGAAGQISVSVPVSLSMTIAAAVGIIVLAYVISMAVAWRIRKISAYALVSE